MFYVDAHAHIKTENTIFKTGILLPENLSGYDISDARPLAVKYASQSEIGLDRRFIHSVSIYNQIMFFSFFFDYLSDNGFPVTLHCVRETEKMVNFLKSRKFEKGSVLWHGFTGSPETARILYGMGVIISVGERKIDLFDSYIHANPLCVIETDYQGENVTEHDCILKSLYERVSYLLDSEVPELSEKFRDILIKFF